MTPDRNEILASRLVWPAGVEAQGDGTLLVRFRDIPSAITDGADRVEALANAFKAMVYSAMRAHGMTQAEMAERLDVDPREVRRMLDPAHTGTKIARYADALAACGVDIEIGGRIRNAA